MMITLYFLLSIGWTLMSMAWFVICNHFMTKAEMPKSLYAFSGHLQRLFCCCFPSPKVDAKTDKKKDAIVENGELNKSVDQDTLNVKYVPGQKLSLPHLQRRIAVENVDKKQDTLGEGIESVNTNPIDVKPIETAACASINTANEMEKPKCNFCNRCKLCQADVDKDKAKVKSKKEFEGRCNALNYFVLLCVILCMFISNMVVWLVMSSS